MAKDRTTITSAIDPPLNLPEDNDIEALIAVAVGVMGVTESPLLGTFTLLTRDGHYDFLIDQKIANAIVQELRAFLRGDSPPLLEDE